MCFPSISKVSISEESQPPVPTSELDVSSIRTRCANVISGIATLSIKAPAEEAPTASRVLLPLSLPFKMEISPLELEKAINRCTATPVSMSAVNQMLAFVAGLNSDRLGEIVKISKNPKNNSSLAKSIDIPRLARTLLFPVSENSPSFHPFRSLYIVCSSKKTGKDPVETGKFKRIKPAIDFQGKPVAIGVIFKTRTGKKCPISKRIINKEIENLKRMKGADHIVQLYDSWFDSSNQKTYMCMEMFTGGSLFKRIELKRELTSEERKIIARDIGLALLELKRERLNHGDLKPENTMLVLNQGKIIGAKLIDLGLATWFSNDHERAFYTGTICYSPPEARHPVLNKNNYNTFDFESAHKADMFVFGLLLLNIYGMNASNHLDRKGIIKNEHDLRRTIQGDILNSICPPRMKDLISWMLQDIPRIRPSIEKYLECLALYDAPYPNNNYNPLEYG